MLSKYSILALIGASSAAVVGPLPPSAWPKFPNAANPSGTNLNTANDVKPVWVGSGYYRGYRNDIYAFPVQKLVKATSASVFATIESMGTTTRTWWTFDKAVFPTQQAASAEATNMNDVAVGNQWNVCLTIATAKVCNGGVSVFVASSNTNAAIQNRVIIKISLTAAATDIGGSAGSNSSPAFTWQTDILLSAFYHSAATATGTGVWCTAFFNQLDKTGTEVDFESADGFGKFGKCTWQFLSGDKGQAPAIKPTALKFGYFEFQYVEWLTSASLGSNSVLAATEDATYFTGAYATANNEIWLNPATAIFTAATYLPYGGVNKTPNAALPGSVGTAIFYANFEGQWADTMTSTVDQPILSQRISYVNDVYSEYKTQLDTYNTAKSTYNDAANKEAERLKDFFKATFDPPITVPTRPCPPSQPKEYTGAYFDFSAEITAGWKTKYADQKYRASLETTTGSGAKTTIFHGRIGYLNASLDISATTIDVTNIGHIWGRLGQGKMNVYDNALPFVFEKSDEATNKAGMNISTFPSDDNQSGLATADKNTFKAVAKAFVSFDTFKYMARPGGAENPTNVLGAKALAATGLAVAAVVATIA